MADDLIKKPSEENSEFALADKWLQRVLAWVSVPAFILAVIFNHTYLALFCALWLVVAFGYFFVKKLRVEPPPLELGIGTALNEKQLNGTQDLMPRKEALPVAKTIGELTEEIRLLKSEKSDTTLALKLEEKFDSEVTAKDRIAAAKSLKNTLLLPDEELLDKVDTRVDNVLDVFETVGFYLHDNKISAATAHHHFYQWARGYWDAAERYRRQARKQGGKALWKYFDELVNKISEIEAAENKCEVEDLKLSTKEIEKFLDDEISIQRELESPHEKLALTTDTTMQAKCPDESVHELTQYQLKRLQSFILVEDCIIKESDLLQGELYIDFVFSIHNLSLYSIYISTPVGAVIEGSIYFRGKPLNREAKLYEIEMTYINPPDIGSLTIRQWVNSDEANKIAETLKTTGNLFDFSRVSIYVGSDELSNKKRLKLDLTRGMQNTTLKNEAIELRNNNNRLRKDIALWNDRAEKIEELTRTLGMFYLAYNQLEQNEMLSQETANNLKGCFANSLHRCFHDNKVTDDYMDNLPPFPDSVVEQKAWVDSQCFRLRKLIDEQKKGLSNYVQKDGSTPNS